MSMIVIEIGDDYYAMLGISREELSGLGDDEVTKKIRDAKKQVSRSLMIAGNRGDAAARDQVTRINDAANILTDRKKRDKYDLENPGLALFSIQSIIPTYLDPTNKIARIRLVNRILLGAGVEGTLRSFTDLDRSDFVEDLAPKI